MRKIFLVPVILFGYMIGVACGIHIYITGLGIEITSANYFSVLLPAAGVIASTLFALSTVLIYPLVGLIVAGVDSEDEH